MAVNTLRGRRTSFRLPCRQGRPNCPFGWPFPRLAMFSVLRQNKFWQKVNTYVNPVFSMRCQYIYCQCRIRRQEIITQCSGQGWQIHIFPLFSRVVQSGEWLELSQLFALTVLIPSSRRKNVAAHWGGITACPSVANGCIGVLWACLPAPHLIWTTGKTVMHKRWQPLVYAPWPPSAI